MVTMAGTLLGTLTGLVTRPVRLLTVVLVVIVGYAFVTTPAAEGPLDGVRPVFGESCSFLVAASSLNIRSGPSESEPVIATMDGDQPLIATGRVQDGFRELSPGYWAADRFLTPRPGNSC